jgi:hypothetical protein
MRKLNTVVYNKLLLQTEEARDRGMTKLASGVVNALGAMPEDELVSYNFNELQNDVYDGLWKMAACVIKYHDLQSVDAERVNDVLESFASKLIEEIERSLSVDNTQVGALESAVPGQMVANAASYFHNNKKNGYVDLKGGGWGVLVDTKHTPQPGDRVLISFDDNDDGSPKDSVEEIVKEVLHVYPGVGGQSVKDGKLGKYLVSIVSQAQAEKIMNN